MRDIDLAVEPDPQAEPLVFPASSGQQRLWLLDRLEPNSTAYTIPFVARLVGPLQVTALERALTGLVDRHEVLRTTFFADGDAVHQRVAPAVPVRLDVIDVSAEEDPQGAGRAVAAEIVGRRFDLGTGPLLRAGLARLGMDEHMLILALHHCAADGWSIGVLKRDLGELYTAALEQREAALPDLPVQYGDFAAWEREWLAAARMEEQLSHWRRVLDGTPTLIDLATDRPRPVVQSSRGARRRRQLDEALTKQLHTLGQEQGATLFMVLLAGLTALLARHTDQDDIVVGTPVAGRSRIELEDLIGYFANTLALRADVSDDPTFSELLRRVRDVTLDAYANQELPFERLVAALAPERTLSHAPIFQVLFVLQHAAGGPIELPGLEVEVVELERGTAKFDLSIVVAEGREGLRVSCEYSTDLFDAETVDRLLDQYRILLEAAVADPGRRVGELPLLRSEEREQALAAAAAVAPDQPVACLHDLFVRQSERAPDAPAVVHEGAMLTYAQLDRRANQLAHRLRSLGVEREVPVALCLRRSLDLIVAIVATLKAGGAYVPLDPDYPPDRLAFVLADTGSPVVVTEERLLDNLPEHEAAVVCLDREVESLAAEPATAPDAAVDPANLAYVIYTSGSTGTPKGVQVEHRHVARLFSATDDWFGFGPGDTWTLLHSYAFDFSVWEMWGALLHGGKLVVPSHWTAQSPEALARLLVLERVTVLNATPSLFVAAIDELLRVADGLAVRVVIFGGEALRPAALGRWFEHYGASGPELVNMYGITETTVHVTYLRVGPEAVASRGSPIGEAIPDLELHVLDAARAHVPIGVPGEIYVGGAGVARGYLNRPELTAERFIENPFGRGRLYRTGDRARRLADGGLGYLGRLDDQVKIRGYRIELGEVEAALLRHDAVADAAVTVVDVAAGDSRLAAYVVPGADHDDLRAELHEHAEASLPPHMVPASIQTVDALPRTANGKLDRRALPAPAWGAARTIVPPRTPTETALAEIWCEILGARQVGVEDSFFALGGHSMLAVRLFDEIERRLGTRLPLATLFAHDTIAELAATIGREPPTPDLWSPIVALRAEGSRPPLMMISLGNHNSDFLPYRQLVDQLGPDQPVYGLQSPGMDGRTLPVGTVEELAAHYVRELLAFQPRGPHLLVGLTFAGLVAYEIGRQLEQAGQPAVMVATMNTAPAGRKALPEISLNDPSTVRAWTGRRVANLWHNVGIGFYDRLVQSGRRRPRWTPWDLQYIASSRARQRYVAPPSKVHLDCFGTRSELDAERAYQWRPLAGGGVDYHAVVGAADESWRLVFLTRPHVDAIAAGLRQVMDARLAERGRA